MPVCDAGGACLVSDGTGGAVALGAGTEVLIPPTFGDMVSSELEGNRGKGDGGNWRSTTYQVLD